MKEKICGYYLDSEQEKIVLDNSKNILVVAGAGSGKTLTILGKINYLIKYKNIKPDEILCISFTRDASKSLKEKIKKEVNSIVRSTILSHDIELLDYIIKNYKINIKRIKYETQNKKYSLIDITEEVLQGMKNREFRKREFAIYISDLLKPSHKYKKIINNAFNLLKEIEEENILIENYYKYLKQYY